MSLNVDKVREDFSILQKKIVYFDNSCMTLRPKQVIAAMNQYYEEFPACAGRSMHSLGNKITQEVDFARKQIRKHIGAKRDQELIFTRNTTEAINLLSKSFKFQKGDKIVISDKEHNSNLLPWQIMAEKGLIKLEVVNSNPDNTLDLDDFETKIKGAKMLCIVHTSNIDGVTNPVKDLIKRAHKEGALVMLDAAQSVPHKEVNVRNLDVDFLAFSAHKMLGPSGMGAFYGKRELLENMNPFLVGGETVKDTTFNSRVWEELPNRFEAGLQDYAGILGFSQATKYLEKIGKRNIEKHEIKLTKQLTERLDDYNILGPRNAEQRGGITSFYKKGIDPHQIALLLDSTSKVMIRSGAHCAHSYFNLRDSPGTARASVYLYNTEEEVEIFKSAINKIKSILH